MKERRAVAQGGTYNVQGKSDIGLERNTTREEHIVRTHHTHKLRYKRERKGCTQTRTHRQKHVDKHSQKAGIQTANGQTLASHLLGSLNDAIEGPITLSQVVKIHPINVIVPVVGCCS